MAVALLSSSSHSQGAEANTTLGMLKEKLLLIPSDQQSQAVVNISKGMFVGMGSMNSVTGIINDHYSRVGTRGSLTLYFVLVDDSLLYNIVADIKVCKALLILYITTIKLIARYLTTAGNSTTAITATTSPLPPTPNTSTNNNYIYICNYSKYFLYCRREDVDYT